MEDNYICSSDSPKEYYESLRKFISGAKRKITLSALYLGSKELERNLIAALNEALNDSSRPYLQVTIILDHSRASRLEHSKLSGVTSSVLLLSQLVQNHHPRCQLLLYQMPQLRSVFIEALLPSQYKEILGVYHCKFNLFDELVLLTGANLSDEYFTSRRDRYLYISPAAADGDDEGDDDDLMI